MLFHKVAPLHPLPVTADRPGSAACFAKDAQRAMVGGEAVLKPLFQEAVSIEFFPTPQLWRLI